jgi:hypothetical protein
MMVANSFFSLFFLLFMQTGVPLGLPPLPEDPALARVAPEQCVWYFSWSGVAEPDPKSKNQTEQLIAEPEVRRFVAQLGKALGDALQKGAPPTPQGKVLGAEGPKLIHALLTHPTALFISHVAVGPNGPDVSGGAIVSTGDQTEEIKAALENIEHTLLPTATAPGEAGWHKLPMPPGMPLVQWGFRGKYLMLGIGAGSADGIVSRGKGQPPAWLIKIKERLPVERASTVHYLNVKTVVTVAEPMMGGPGATAIVAALGLGNVEQFANVTGLDGTGYVSKSWLQVAGEPSGLLSAVGPEPLTAADLAPIPQDASFAVTARIHSAQVWSAILAGINKVDPSAGAQAAAGIKQAEAAVGFRFKEDLLDTLGDSWCVYNSPGEGGLFITGLTIVVPVKDHDRLAKTNDRLVQLARAAADAQRATPLPRFSRRPGTEIRETTFQAQKIFSFSSIGSELPFAPAWCVTDNQLILSLSAQNIRAILARDPAAKSLAAVSSVAERLKNDSPVLLTYQDSAAMWKLTYPVLQMVATSMFAEMQRAGLDLDPSILPSLPSMLRHIEPAASTLAREKEGLVYVSRRTSPVDISLVSLLPVWFGFVFARAEPSFDAPRTVPESAEAAPEPAAQPAPGQEIPLRSQNTEKPVPPDKPLRQNP